MAKKSVVNRNKKRGASSSDLKVRAKRAELKSAVCDANLAPEERREAMHKLQKMRRDCSPARFRNRCKLCGRPRAYNRLTGLCRLHMRIATIAGMVPGMHKASW